MRFRATQSRLVMTAGLVLAASAFDCENAVTIRYTQLATCGTLRYANQPGPNTGGGHSAILVYRIDAIENTGMRPQPFHFDPANLRTGSPAAPAPASISTPPGLNTAIAQWVPRGQTTGPIGRYAIAYDTPSGSTSGNRVNLYYSGYSTVMVASTASPMRIDGCDAQNVPS